MSSRQAGNINCFANLLRRYYILFPIFLVRLRTAETVDVISAGEGPKAICGSDAVRIAIPVASPQHAPIDRGIAERIFFR